MLIIRTILLAALCISELGAADTTPSASADVERLAAGLIADSPELTPAEARAHAAGALAAASDHVTAEVLLGLAWRESHYHSDAGPMCGVDQVSKRELREQHTTCRELLAAGIPAQYRAGAIALEEHFETCRRKGHPTVKCMLNSYAEGPAAGARGWGVKGCPAKTHCDRSAVPLTHARRIGSGGARDRKPRV